MGTITKLREMASDQPTDETVKATLTRAAEILTREVPYIANTDLDGVLSAQVLQRALGWHLAGLGDCGGRKTDTVWLIDPKSAKDEKLTFVDMFVKPHRCVDQHIVATCAKHAAELRATPGKLNPNLEWVRTMETNVKGPHEYKWKYPFGTVHFLIACLEGIGIEVPLVNHQFDEGFCSLDLILRADDAAHSTAVKYRQNCINWWLYLCLLGGPTTTALAKHAVNMPADEETDRKARVEQYIKGHDVAWIRADGGFGTHLKKRGVDAPLTEFVTGISGRGGLGADLHLPTTMTKIELKGERGPTYTSRYVEGALASPELFSYAVTAAYGPGASSGFSTSHGSLTGE